MKTILHCDLNNFFASVECIDRPELKIVPMAVCGSQDDRHGIVLAKNELAKAVGVKTAETIWQARQKCPQLEIVPPHHEKYIHYSKQAQKIYANYTDRIEPFGIDECWLDVTGSTTLFGDGKTIADKLRQEMREKIGLTISVGVSFNKIFAKLGSDIKKPDGTTVITKENFKDIVWRLPAEDLMGVGKSTKKRLNSVGIYTIGEIANTEPERLRRMLGKCGYLLWKNAMGLDDSEVDYQNYQSVSKSIGNSTTCKYDLENDEEVWKIFLELSDEISKRLREENVMAGNVVISIKDTLLNYSEHSIMLYTPSRSSEILANTAMEIFKKNWEWARNVRALGIRATSIISEPSGVQTSLFINAKDEMKKEKLESSVDILRKKFGKNIVQKGRLIK